MVATIGDGIIFYGNIIKYGIPDIHPVIATLSDLIADNIHNARFE